MEEVKKRNRRAYNKQWRLDNPEKARASDKRYREKNKDKRAAYAKEYSKRRKRDQSKSYRKYKYGLTNELYEQMLQDQKGLCAVCNNPPVSFKPVLYVDHCHSTGKVRGLLCHFCNAGIGMLKDDPELLKKAIKYLEQ